MSYKDIPVNHSSFYLPKSIRTVPLTVFKHLVSYLSNGVLLEKSSDIQPQVMARCLLPVLLNLWIKY